MARPTTKHQLLELSQRNNQRLIALIEEMPREEQLREFPSGTMNRNIADVICHLHEWHLMMQTWYALGMKGGKPDMPATGYTWKTTAQLNYEIWKRYRSTDVNEALDQFASSYASVRKLIEGHSDEELFTKKKYPWTGSTSLGSYLVSCTSSHYDWAYKLIKKAKKN